MRALPAAILFASLLALASGAWLAVGYQTAPADANASVAGASPWLRGVHAWSASAALALVLVAVFGRFSESPSPRRVVALLGAGLGAFLLMAFESGAILAWDQRGWEAFEHVQDAAGLVGVTLGEVGAPSATPLGLILVAHVLFSSVAGGVAAALVVRATRPSLRTMLASAGLVVVAVGALAFVWPPFLGPAPVADLSVSRPHWPFVWVTPLETWFGSVGLLALPVVFVAGGWFAWRSPEWSVSARRRITWGALVLFLGLTLLGLAFPA